MTQININVVGEPTDLPVLRIDGRPEAYTARLEPGRAIFTLDDAPANVGATITYNGLHTVRVITPPPGTWEADLPPVRPPEAIETIELRYQAELRRLFIADQIFVDDHGQRIVLGLSTDFRLFQMFKDAEDIEPVVAQRIAAGAQGFRVFGTCHFLFDLDPREDATYYTHLRLFVDVMADRGLYVQFTAMADAQLLAPGFQQRDHWERCCDVLADAPNVFVELANEAVKNGVDPRQFSKPGRAPWVSSGSFSDGWEPTGAWGDIVTFHPRRDWKWAFTIPATVNELREYPGQRKPIWIGEPIGAADRNEPGRRANDPALFEKMGADVGLWAAGGVFHSEAGLTSGIWSGPQEDCARAFFRGLHR